MFTMIMQSRGTRTPSFPGLQSQVVKKSLLSGSRKGCSAAAKVRAVAVKVRASGTHIKASFWKILVFWSTRAWKWHLPGSIPARCSRKLLPLVLD